MVNFVPSSEQLEMVTTARRFADAEMVPVAAELDRTAAYPWEPIRRAHVAGLLNLSLRQSCGGLGLAPLDQVMIAEELGRGCAGIAAAMGANDLALTPLMLVGTEEQIDEFARPMGREPMMASYAITEPNTGSDVAAIRTTATRHGDSYIIDGEKMWITNASVASWFYVLATLDSERGTDATAAFLVPASSEGISIGRKEVTMGQRCSDTRAVRFDKVKIPRRNLLGKEGEGFRLTMRTFDHTRPMVAAAAVGVARRALELATAYAKERKTFGKPIIEHQAVAFMLADMAKDIEAARLITWKAAAELGAGRPAAKWAAMAKCLAGDAAMKATTDAVQVFGGYGYSNEFPVEKLMRDAKIYQIYEGTQQIQRMIIARCL